MKILKIIGASSLLIALSPPFINEIIASSKEALDGKSITAWFRACQILNTR